MQILKEKKAQVTGSVGVMVSLVVGIGVAVLVFIFVGSLGGQTFELVEDDLDSIGDGGSSSREAVTLLFAADGGTQLIHGDIQTVTNVSNGSMTIPATYYTVNLASGAVTLVNVSYNNTPANVTYTFANTSVRDPIKNAIISSFDALGNTGGYLPLIVLAIIITLVLGIVMGLSGGMSRGGGKSQVL